MSSTRLAAKEDALPGAEAGEGPVPWDRFDLALARRRDRSLGRGGVLLASDLTRALDAIPSGSPSGPLDFRALAKRGVDSDLLDAAAVSAVEAAPDAFVALVWPSAQGRDDEIESILGPLLYAKSVTLTSNGAHNLLSHVYAGEPWLGDPDRNFPGIGTKLAQCFSRPGPVRVLAFRKVGLAETLAAKDAVRERFGLGKHSIHITDTHAEAVMVARFLFNDRGVHFLNRAQPTRFPATRRQVAGLRDHLENASVLPEDVAVDSGLVLAAYGVREAQDVDFLTTVPMPDDDAFSPHGGGAHGVGIADLLDDPRLHFHAWGLKFLSLEQVARMKTRRKAGRDLEDLRAIAPLLAPESSGMSVARLRADVRFAVAKARRRLIDASRAMGVYGALRRLKRPRRKT